MQGEMAERRGGDRSLAVLRLALIVLAVGMGGQAFGAEPPPAPAPGPLKVHPQNPRYFADPSGRAVLLAGSHTWPSIVDMSPSDPPAKFDFNGFLDFLERHGHNFTRLWAWDLVAWNTKTPKRDGTLLACGPLPYLRTGPGLAKDGKPRFDLTKYDPEYFGRLRTRVEAAGRRGIYASVMLFEGCILQQSPSVWETHPFHPENNINGVNGDANGDGIGVEVHELGNPAVTALQEAYVRKVIETLGDLDNLLWEISNENHPASTEWQYHMIRFIKEVEKSRPKQHPVGMTFQYRGGRNRVLFDSPADWISPNSTADVPKGFDYRANPPPADGRKVVLSDTDHLWGIGGNATWVWKTFLRGHSPIFMDPYDGTVLGPRDDAKWDPVRKAMGSVLSVARRLNLAAMTPQDNLASSGYCLAGGTKAGAQYLVYLPDGGKATVDLSAAAGEPLVVEWIDLKTGKATPGEPVEGGAKREFTAPAPGDAIIHIRTK